VSLTLREARSYPAGVSTTLEATRASDDARAKEARLFARLAACESVVVAYSGGVDSAYLAWAAHRALGARALAVTAISPSYPRSHRELAGRVARAIGFAHEWIDSHEHERADYARNAPDRCYHCKTELFDLLDELCRKRGFEAVAYGINLDDTGDFRPGHRAADEHRVLSPLLDAGLGKSEIRALSAAAGLETAELPASACLSSRVPYGMEVTPEKLAQIDRAEDALRALGYRQLRVRHHGDLARVELAREELPRALAPDALRALSRAVHEAGFRWVALDADGYRTGSANEVLQIAPPPGR
jgi:pyridinium-3,5-biscarboxylic acid mononucleotide sulfurtransferase